MTTSECGPGATRSIGQPRPEVGSTPTRVYKVCVIVVGDVLALRLRPDTKRLQQEQ